MSTTGPAAGWYSDPGNPGGGLRWWDGTQWTAQVRQQATAGPPSVAPYEGAAAMPGQAPGGPMPYGQTSTQPAPGTPMSYGQPAPGTPMSYGQPSGQYPYPQGQAPYPQGQAPYPQGQFPQAQVPAYGARMGRPGGMGGAGGTFARRNQLSLTAAALALLYFFLAISTHFVLFGIAPALMCVRAFQRKEQLAPLALVAAIVAIGTAVVFFR